MRELIASLVSSLVMALCPLPASAADPNVQAMADTFVAALPAGWGVTHAQWEFLDVADCFLTKESCFGNNPSSPYGYPIFNHAPRFLMAPSEAVVVFMRTPPEMRYFGFTQYLISRGAVSEQVLASLSDSLNLTKFVTLTSSAPGQNVFNQYAVLVWTADLNTLASVKALLALQGIEGSKVNVLPLPVTLPLNMGYSVDADVFSLLFRVALPKVQAEFDAYRIEVPFAVMKLAPSTPPPLDPAPVIGYASERSGVPEDPALATALNELVADIKANYRRSFKLEAQVVRPFLAKGLDCIAGTTSACILDSHDSLYSADLTATSITVRNLQDVVIVAGVNHRTTGKTLYMNHSVNDPVKSTGIVTVDDTLLVTASALYHAGVKLPGDPRVQRYKNLYAYAVSYDCNGLKHCMNIPPPTPEKPVGLPPGAAFGLWERNYVDPHTGVRPDENEVVRQQVLVGTKR
jgi:hypothetical protein